MLMLIIASMGCLTGKEPAFGPMQKLGDPNHYVEEIVEASDGVGILRQRKGCRTVKRMSGVMSQIFINKKTYM